MFGIDSIRFIQSPHHYYYSSHSTFFHQTRRTKKDEIQIANTRELVKGCPLHRSLTVQRSIHDIFYFALDPVTEYLRFLHAVLMAKKVIFPLPNSSTVRAQWVTGST